MRGMLVIPFVTLAPMHCGTVMMTGGHTWNIDRTFACQWLPLQGKLQRICNTTVVNVRLTWADTVSVLPSMNNAASAPYCRAHNPSTAPLPSTY